MAYYKTKVTYKNPEWIDGISTLDDMDYFQTTNLVIEPPPEVLGIIQQEHLFTQRATALLWSGQVPIHVGKDVFIHPGRIVKVELLQNVDVAQIDANKINLAKKE